MTRPPDSHRRAHFQLNKENNTVKKIHLTAAVLAAVSAFAGTAQAGGFQLTEQSALALGRAYAGVGVDGTDISGVYYNPATMVLHTGTKVQGGGVIVGLNLDYADKDNEANDQNGRGAEKFVPHGFISHQINDSTWVGLSITVPFGMSTEYSENWGRKNHGTDAEIMVIDFNPNVAWKLNDKFSIGAGISLQYADASLGLGADVVREDLKINDSIRGELEVDTFAWGWNVGMMWRPVDTIRVGLSYRSEVRHNAEGDLWVKGTGKGMSPLDAIKGKYDGSVEMSAPAWAMLSAAWDVNDMLSLYAMARWTDWSSFKELNIESTGLSNRINGIIQDLPPESQKSLAPLINGIHNQMTHIQNNWKDTYLGAVGADLRVNDFWTLRGGIAYETSPIDRPENRMAIIPDANRWWFAVGSSFKWTKQFQTDVSFAHLHGVGERNLYDSKTGDKIGRFRKLDAFLFGLQAQYTF